MRSALFGYIYMLLAVCMLFVGIHTDLDHWFKYDADSGDTLGEACITSPDEYPKVEIAIRQSEQMEAMEVRILPGKLFRKIFFAELDALLPKKTIFLLQRFITYYDYERDEIEIPHRVLVVVDYVHHQDGMKRI